MHLYNQRGPRPTFLRKHIGKWARSIALTGAPPATRPGGLGRSADPSASRTRLPPPGPKATSGRKPLPAVSRRSAEAAAPGPQASVQLGSPCLARGAHPGPLATGVRMPPPGGPLLRNGRTCLCVHLPLSEFLAYGLQGLGKQRLRNDTPRKKELHDLTRNKCFSEISPSPRYLTVGFFFFFK